MVRRVLHGDTNQPEDFHHEEHEEHEEHEAADKGTGPLSCSIVVGQFRISPHSLRSLRSLRPSVESLFFEPKVAKAAKIKDQ